LFISFINKGGRKMFDVAALGELLIDFTPGGYLEQGNPVYEQNPGGAPANVLVTISRLGKKGAFLGMVGKDQFGSFLRSTLQKEKIEVRGLKVSNDIHTTLAFVHLDPKGERSFSFYRNPGADLMLRPEDVDFQSIKDSRIFHFGSVSMAGEPAKSATLAAVRYAKENGILVSFDPNYRPLLWKSEEEAQSVIQEGLKYADILKVSAEELALITGTTDLEAGASELFKQGINLILITLGPGGCFFYCSAGFGLVPSFAVKTVDTTGAGDAFWGAALYHLCTKAKEELAQISIAEMQKIVRFSCAAGALTTTKKGAIPGIPFQDQIEIFLKEKQ
jgi:fructokinase